MSTQPKVRYTPEEYLEMELAAETKHEYFDGEIFDMSGASSQHVLIVTNIIGELRAQLKKRPCKVFSTDLRLRVSPTGLYTYPDVIVVCGEARFAENQKDTLTNPTLIVEVLSNSTANYDRGLKFEHYRTLESLSDYLLVAQDKPHVVHFARQPDNRWLLTEAGDIRTTVELPSINCHLALAEIYDKVGMPGVSQETT